MSRRWWAPVAATAAGLVVATVAAGQDGSRGLWSALLGTGLVVGFLASGLLPLLLVRGQEGSASLGAGVLLLNYTFRLAVAVAVLRVAGRSEHVEPRWTAFAVIAAALVWAGAQAAAVLRRDDPDRHDPHDAGHGAGHGLSGGGL